MRKAVLNVLNFLRLLPLLFEKRSDRRLRPLFRAYLGWIPLCVFSEPRVWLRLLVNARQRFQHEDQRPHSFYAPHLSAIPFAPADDVSRFLEGGFDRIRKEYDRIEADKPRSPSVSLLRNGDWTTFPLIRAARTFPANIDVCPETWGIVKRCPLPFGVRGGVYFSVLAPGTIIAPHCGPSNLKYRYHLTIHAAEGAQIRSGQRWRTWREGECLVLDDSFEHEVRHDGQHVRVVLIVDCWHPDLSELEKDVLELLHERLLR